MMGQQGGNHDRPFYSFNLDSHVPADHLLRGIDRFLDLGELRQHLAPFYSHTGRPSIDSELLIRMLIVGYCFGIRSERRLYEEVHLNLAYRWFCRLGLEDLVPDHSTFSKNRHGRFRDIDTLRFVFEQVLERCVREGAQIHTALFVALGHEACWAMRVAGRHQGAWPLRQDDCSYHAAIGSSFQRAPQKSRITWLRISWSGLASPWGGGR